MTETNMAELVIKIPEDVFKRTVFNREVVDLNDCITIIKALEKAIQLPKGHGRLMVLSEDAVKREQTPLSFSYQNWISEVGLSNATVAIIEADKVESEDKE